MMRLLISLVSAGLLLAQRSPVEEAWESLAKGDRAQAVQLLRRIIRTAPHNGEARLMLGSILAEDGDRTESISQLSEGVRLLPQSPGAHNALGEALKNFGELPAARAEFEKAVTLNREFAVAHENLGFVLLQAGEPAEAGKHLDRAIHLFGAKPEAAYAKYLRAKIYAEANQTEKAVKELSDAITLRPDFAEAWSDLGQARKNLLDDAGALVAFERSVALDPDSAVAQYRLGSELLSQGDIRKSIAHLDASYRLNPKDQSMLYRLQLALRADGQLERARKIKEELTEALREIDRESQRAFTALRLNNEGAELEKAGRRKAALEKYREAVRLDPDHVGIRVNFAVALLRLGNWAEGLAELREAARRDPKDARIQNALKDALAQAPPQFK
ncbi:MAG: tetratricopeptide repeat protein [Bryobacterales bacterium]|nr:tetratricopeptide repeat protein [Bryobacterales bacterium]